MPKFQYMVTEDYVRDWTPKHALREVIANGVDAEIQASAPLHVVHDPRKDILRVINDRAKLDIKALYFGGTTKVGDTRLVGQYGEGLKLALLVFARNDIGVKIYNNDEVWTASLEPDANGIKVLTIHTRKAKTTTGTVEIEISSVPYDMWCETQTMFLRLMPPINKIDTDHGSIIFDPDRVGQYYARGVYISHRAQSAFSYDFKHLNVGRDRASFDVGMAENEVFYIWSAALKESDQAATQLYRALRNDAKDLSAFEWMNRPEVSEKLVSIFKEEHGATAYPVTSTNEDLVLEHCGLRGIVLPNTLVRCLLRSMPSISQLKVEKANKVQKEYAGTELEAEERRTFTGALDLLAESGFRLHDRVVVVDFHGAHTLGRHEGERILIARSILKDWGETVVTLIHEAAHDFGRDGAVAHIATEEQIFAKVFNRLRKAGQTLRAEVSTLPEGSPEEPQLGGSPVPASN